MTNKFNFGINWQEYSAQALDQTRIKQAVQDLNELVGKENLEGKSFFDIGCGSGIHSLAAAQLGAEPIVAMDISSESIQSAQHNQARFLPESQIDFQLDSLLTMKSTATYDVVYSWGVLHHTGNMKQAIKQAAKRVKPKGLLVMAIYNRHWSSPLWWQIKRLYNLSPRWLQKLMIIQFAGVIAAAKFLVTGKNPFTKKRRGMTFYYDVIDWLGGFPYQYASKQEVVGQLDDLGFRLEKFVPASVPTGCHEYVFKKM